VNQALLSALVAAVVAVVVLQVGAGSDDDSTAGPTVLNFTMENIEDSIVNGARYPGAEQKLLVDAENSICFLTKVHFKAMQGPEDASTCSIELDEFTGFWQVSAIVDEGSTSEVRCNGRCLVWE